MKTVTSFHLSPDSVTCSPSDFIVLLTSFSLCFGFLTSGGKSQVHHTKII